METSTRLQVEAYVRSDHLHGPVSHHLRTLQEIANSQHVSLQVELLPARVDLCEETPSCEAIDVFTRMKQWELCQSGSVELPFAVETIESPVTNDRQTVLRIPTMSLLIGKGDAIVTVAPHARENMTLDISQTIEDLRRNRLALGTPCIPRASEIPEWCTTCDESLLSMEDIAICRSCDDVWVGDPSAQGRDSTPLTPLS